jgi:hypothetical protein
LGRVSSSVRFRFHNILALPTLVLCLSLSLGLSRMAVAQEDEFVGTVAADYKKGVNKQDTGPDIYEPDEPVDEITRPNNKMEFGTTAESYMQIHNLFGESDGDFVDIVVTAPQTLTFTVHYTGADTFASVQLGSYSTGEDIYLGEPVGDGIGHQFSVTLDEDALLVIATIGTYAESGYELTVSGSGTSVPGNADADGDGLTASEEADLQTSDLEIDSDRDGMADGFEVEYSLDPLVDDSDEDPDGDQIPNLEEYLLNSNPRDPNSPYPTFFVDTNGNDTTGDGSTAAPWQSIGSAIGAIATMAPARIVIRGGTYTENITLTPGVDLIGERDSTVNITGSITGASNCALRNLVLLAAAGGTSLKGGNSFLLDLNDVPMVIQEVLFVGTTARTVSAIRMVGASISTIEDCTFESVGVGIDVGGSIPAIRRCTFDNIASELGNSNLPGAGIILREQNGAKVAGLALGDESDPEDGWNDFLPSINGFAVINERPTAILMQTNYWGVADAGAATARVSGPSAVEPIFAEKSALLASTVFCAVTDASTQGRILDASVELEGSPFGVVTDNIDGVYAFPAVAGGAYKLRVSTPDFEEESKDINIGAGEIRSVSFAMGASGGGCFRAASAQKFSQYRGDILLLSLVLLAFWGARISKRTTSGNSKGSRIVPQKIPARAT